MVKDGKIRYVAWVWRFFHANYRLLELVHGLLEQIA
jgi:hypothetical protein